MRPKTLDEYVGQEHIIAPGKMLRRAIEADMLSSIILYGPPGTGKTTLANIIANTTAMEFTAINATTSGKKDMQEVIASAQKRWNDENRGTLLFIDEIHRFNKAQQDYLLPFVENGTVVLVGATTENPYFEVNGALLSRSTIFKLELLSKYEIVKTLKRAKDDKENGFGNIDIEIGRGVFRFWADMANGDARSALSAFDLAVRTTPPDENGTITINMDAAKDCIQKRSVRYDKDGDKHYDNISAFIKSMRGSNPDAAVYYMARMLSAGEDPKYIARRIMVHASEDVGNADPMALVVASAAAEATDRIGMPEARIILAQAAIYVACAPKSNTCVSAIGDAMETVKNTWTQDVPIHLRDAHYKGAAKFGHGVDYVYPHDYPYHYVKQQYMPDNLTRKTLWNPGTLGTEGMQKKWIEFLRKEYDYR